MLLLGETESNGDKNSIEATEVGTPSDSDFAIPDNVQSVPTLPSQ